MTIIDWSKNIGLPELTTAVKALEARVKALETVTQSLMTLSSRLQKLEDRRAEWDKVSADHWVLREELRVRNTGARLNELESYINENTWHRIRNVNALRAVLTLLHPDEEHPPITDEIIPNGTWLHEVMMFWIGEYGRLPVGETGEVPPHE